jgi:hypothetical protein
MKPMLKILEINNDKFNIIMKSMKKFKDMKVIMN